MLPPCYNSDVDKKHFPEAKLMGRPILDFQLLRGLLFYFIKYPATGTRLYSVNKTKMVPKGTCNTQYQAVFLLLQLRKGKLLCGGQKQGDFSGASNTCLHTHSVQCVQLGDRSHSPVCCCELWDDATIEPNYLLLWMTQAAFIQTPSPHLGNQRLDGREKAPCHSSD